MIEIIEVDTFVKELGDNVGGMSRPIQVIGSNGKEYLLKNQFVYNETTQSWEQWDSMFMQEVLVHRIARFLNINIPDCAIANVDQAFLQHAPSLIFTHRYVPGYHFASNVIKNVENNLASGYIKLMQLGKPHIKRSWNNFFKGISNKDDVSKMIVLDLLTANFDRFGNVGNLIIATNDNDRLLYCIDHGHCFWGASWSNLRKRNMMMMVSDTSAFKQEWTNDLLSNTGHAFPMSGLGDIFRALNQFVDVSDPGNHCFNDIVLKVETITPELIDSWFADIPDEWFIDKTNQVPLYKYFLMEQKKLIRWFISFMAQQGAFENYLGGKFSWNEKPTGTQ